VKNEFLHNQPHPETDGTACTVPDDSARLLNPALQTEVEACGGAWTANEFFLFCAAPKSCSVTIQRGREPDLLDKGKQFAVFEFPVTGISCFETTAGFGVCICAGDIFIFDQNGLQTGRLGITARHASVLIDGTRQWIAYDGKLRGIKNFRTDNSANTSGARIEFDGPAVTSSAAPGFIAPQNRRDALHIEGRHWPGKQGGCLFKHEGLYYYFCADFFNRCFKNNLDSFCCTAESLTGRFERRYLVIPNGGIANAFHGPDGKVYAAFTGQGDSSAVNGRPAILPLDFINNEFFRPSPSFILETGQVPSLHPFRDIELRDTFIFNSPDGFYYMTGTTRRSEGTFWDGTNGICIWRSRDLKKFEFIGKVFDYHDFPDSWQNNVSRNKNCWAPEITFYDSTFWLTYSTAPGCGLLKSKTGKIEGPYADMGRFVNKGIDSGFFLEGEELYLIWQNGRIAPLSRECTVMTEEPVHLLPADGQQVGYEGAGLIKVKSKYVLYAAEWNGDSRIDGTYDMMYSVSDNLYGPYCKRRLLVPHGGHGCLFFDKQGELRFTMFGNDRSAPFRRRAGIGTVNIEERDGDLLLSV